eukprot:UN31053
MDPYFDGDPYNEPSVTLHSEMSNHLQNPLSQDNSDSMLSISKSHTRNRKISLSNRVSLLQPRFGPGNSLLKEVNNNIINRSTTKLTKVGTIIEESLDITEVCRKFQMKERQLNFLCWM